MELVSICFNTFVDDTFFRLSLLQQLVYMCSGLDGNPRPRIVRARSTKSLLIPQFSPAQVRHTLLIPPCRTLCQHCTSRPPPAAPGVASLSATHTRPTLRPSSGAMVKAEPSSRKEKTRPTKEQLVADRRQTRDSDSSSFGATSASKGATGRGSDDSQYDLKALSADLQAEWKKVSTSSTPRARKGSLTP